MLALELPDTPWHDAVLQPEARTTKGGTTPVSLEGWVSLQEPLTIPLTADRVADDPDLRAFVLAKADSSFYLVRLGCSFRPADEPFVSAWLRVLLARADAVPEPLPIAWSMEPRRLKEPVEVTRTLKLGPSLKLPGGVVSAEASAEQVTKFSRDEILLDALNEGRPDPIWEFTRTQTAEVRGSFRLSLVVLAPKGVAVGGTIHLDANIRRKRLGFLPYQAAFPDSPIQRFVLA